MAAMQSRARAAEPAARREEMFGHVGPLAAASLLALASIALPTASRDDGGLVAAALLTAALLVLAVLERHHWLPRWAWAAAPLGSLAVIALLRDATGGADSGLGWLALLPVIWLALHGTRAELVAAIAGVGAVFALPVVLAGAPDYPAAELQRALVATFASAAVGFSVQQLVRAYRRETLASVRHAAALTESEAVTRSILQSAHEAFVSMDAGGHITAWNPQACELFGHTEEEAIGRSLAETIVPTGLRERHRRGLERFLAGGEPRVLGQRVEQLAVHRDGHEFPVEMTISAVPTAAGHTFHAFLHDITDRKRAEDRLRDDARTMKAIAEAIGALSVSTDRGAARLAICEAARELTGAPVVTLAEPDGRDRLTVTAAAGSELPPISVDNARERSEIAVAFLSRQPFFAADAAAHPSVSPRTLALMGAASVLHQPVLLGDEAAGVLSMWWTRRAPEPSERMTAAIGLLAGHAAAAIERSDLLERLGLQARTDALTGLPNRRTWDEQLPVEIERARAAGHPLSVAILDMDRFRAYNESHGHPGGDRLLKETAAAWRGVLRAVDVVARYGGEEFGILLPGAGSDEAIVIVERARAVTPGGQTCSAGIATWDGEESASALVARADRALYAAKQAGRDRALLA